MDAAKTTIRTAVCITAVPFRLMLGRSVSAVPFPLPEVGMVGAAIVKRA